MIVLVARGAEAAALRPFTSALAAPVTTSVLTSPHAVDCQCGPRARSAVSCEGRCEVLERMSDIAGVVPT